MDTSNNWLSTFVGSTTFRYLVTAISGWAALKLGLDPTQGATAIGGVISAVVALAMLIWGAWESSRSKVVVNGVKVPLSQMTPLDQSAVATIAAKHS